MASKWIVAGLATSFFSLLFNIIAIATPNWLIHHTHDDTVHVGLFRLCRSNQQDCGDIGNLYALLDESLVVWFHMAQGCFMIGFFGCFISVVIPCLLHTRFFDIPNWFRPISAIAFATCMMQIVPLVIIGYLGPGMFVLDSSYTTIDWSYGIAIVAVVSLFMTVVSYFIQSIVHRRAITLTTRPINTVWQMPYSVFVNEDNNY